MNYSLTYLQFMPFNAKLKVLNSQEPAMMIGLVFGGSIIIGIRLAQEEKEGI